MAKKKKKGGRVRPVTRLAWTFHPLRSNFKHLVMVVFLIIFFCLIVYWNFKDISLTVLALVIFVFSLKTFFFPTCYTLKENEILVKNIFTQKYDWARFRRYAHMKRGIFLSPYEKPSRMEQYRGVALFCEGDTCEKVMAIVEERLK